jgi:multicomponent Na+:H+ antiporter subunit D
MNLVLLFPILIPFATAVACLVAWKQRHVQRVLSITGAVLLQASGFLLLVSVWQSGIQAVQMGNWPAPFGITLVSDLFSAIMIVMAGLTGLTVLVYSLADMDTGRESFGYHPLMHILLMGVCGAFITGDVFNLYVWFEVMLIASFVLLGLGGEKAQLEGTVKYVTLNLMSSALFLAAVGIMYGAVGTLNMADLARHMGTVKQPGLVTTLATLFLLAFGIKAAIFPLFFWLPASYPTPPAPIAAIFAGLLTKVGIYALIRVFTLLFVQDLEYTHALLLVLAGLTMISGILGALVQNELRRILSFVLVSHIGFMIMGLGIFTHLAITASVFYIVHDVIVKTGLFLVGGVVRAERGTYEMSSLGGLYSSNPWLSALFLLPALSVGGIPPLSGFWGKLVLVKAGMETGQYLIVATALIVALLSLLVMMKIWADAFWRDSPGSAAGGSVVSANPVSFESRLVLFCPIGVLGLLTLAAGIFAEPVLTVCSRAADQLLNTEEYIRAVLGGIP